MYTNPFGEISKHDAHKAGGKGASLGEMIQNGIPVPDGYVVLAHTFDAFLHETNLVQVIDTILQDVNTNAVQTIEKASKKIQALIAQSEVPEAIADEIKKSFETLNAEFVAIRSSATAEDGAEHAWAGQLSSYLNIKEGSVVESVKLCWASLFTPRAIFYRYEKHLHDSKISVAVVVQKMVNSEKSGVAFSVHPITEDMNQIIIEAGLGLGEAIVSGEVTPDSYVVSKAPLTILETNVNEQTKALFRSVHEMEDGHNEWHELDTTRATAQVLSEEETHELASLIMKIEQHYGFPCDIEWAFEDGAFYITQSRPITTLGKAVAGTESVIWEKMWEAGNAPIFEMTHGTLLAHETQVGLGLLDTQIAVIGSKEKISAYYTKQSLAQAGEDGYNFFLSKGGQLFLKEVGRLILEAQASVAKKENKEVALASFEETSYLLRKVFGYFNLTNPQFTSKIETEVKEQIAEIVSIDSEAVFRDLCVSAKVSLLQQEQLDWMCLVLEAMSASSEEKERFVTAHYEKYKYLVGDEGNQKVTVVSLKQQLEKDIDSGEDFSSEVDMLRSYTDRTVARKAVLIEAHALSSELVSSCELLADIGHLRLELRSAWTALFHVLRAQLEYVVEQHKLSYDNVLQYTADEIVRYLSEGTEFKKRPDEFSLVLENAVWEIAFGNEARTKHDFQVDNSNIDSEHSTIKGNVAYPGVVRGKVVVIEWGSEDFEAKISDFPEGAIMVAGQTRPMLVPAIKRAAAIVTDEGGITSHAAIVAREFQKPCIIGTKIATEFLHDGDEVIVDANKGVITILTKNTNECDPEDYIRMFVVGSLSYLVSDLFMNHYRDLGVLAMFKGASWMCVLPKTSLSNTLEEGGELYTDEESFSHYKNTFALYIIESSKVLDSILSKTSPLTASEVKEFLGLITKYWSFYSKTEFFYTDKIDLHKMVASVAEFDKIKLDGRTHLNKLIFEESGYLRSLLAKIAEQTKQTEDGLLVYSADELAELLDTGTTIDEQMSKDRKTGFVQGEITLIGEESQKVAQVFFDTYQSVSKLIEGTVANPGKARGLARVIELTAKDFDKIADAVEKMEFGEILVAETTSPEIIQACKKSAAIVTNQGGVLSHAAIISRELNIPCIIGTNKDVILSIKTGDLLEVDADSGIVKVIENGPAQ
jgi:phosphoenolpyruvate synthase/pyruvate phosphate dikinase